MKELIKECCGKVESECVCNTIKEKHESEYEKENEKLRNLLWATHPCEGKYGDDGEMQCNNLNCMIDFKRDSVDDIQNKLIRKSLLSHYHQI
jgi:hypothetical protein